MSLFFDVKFFFHYSFICIKNYISVDENVLAKISGLELLTLLGQKVKHKKLTFVKV